LRPKKGGNPQVIKNARPQKVRLGGGKGNTVVAETEEESAKAIDVLNNTKSSKRTKRREGTGAPLRFERGKEGTCKKSIN